MDEQRKSAALEEMPVERLASGAERALRDAEKRLAGSSHLFLRFIRCSLHNGVLRLEGQLPSFYLKQTAQSLLQGIEGVKRVENKISVVSCTGISSDS
jgi:osmotically-inducible protein OsmY